MLLECTADDLVLTKAFTGALASILRPSLVQQGLVPDEVIGQTAKLNSSGRDGEDVKPWKGIRAAGQGVGSIREVTSTRALVDRLEQECSQAKDQCLAAWS